MHIENVAVSYREIPALKGVSLEVREGEVVSVLGPNGAGKTTLLRTISGLMRPHDRGRITFGGERIDSAPPHRIVKKGIVQVPEGRQIFPDLTVLENLEVGAVTHRDKARVRGNIDWVFSTFPELARRRGQKGGTLSGGEQQMLAIGRALVCSPRLVMLDEPSMGLAPVVVQRIFRIIRDEIRSLGVTILLVEQNAFLSFAVSDRAYILSQGEIVLEGTVDELARNEQVKDSYFRGRGARRE